jgi:hypothetical protein
VLPLAHAELRRLALAKGVGDLELSPATEELFGAYGLRVAGKPARAPPCARASGDAARGAAHRARGFRVRAPAAVKERRAQVGDPVSLAEIEREHLACTIGATRSLAEAASVLGIADARAEAQAVWVEVKQGETVGQQRQIVRQSSMRPTMDAILTAPPRDRRQPTCGITEARGMLSSYRRPRR